MRHCGSVGVELDCICLGCGNFLDSYHQCEVGHYSEASEVKMAHWLSWSFCMSVVEFQRSYVSLPWGWQPPSPHWLATHLIWEELLTITTLLSAKDMGSSHNKHRVRCVHIVCERKLRLYVCVSRGKLLYDRVQEDSCTKKAFSGLTGAFSGQRGLSLFVQVF